MSLKTLGCAGAGLGLLAPGAVLLGVTTLIAPAATGSAACLYNTGSLAVSGSVPRQLTATTTSGQQVVLDQQQLQRAATIVAVGTSENIPANGELVALVAAFTESELRVLANTNVPTSASLPNDGTGSDHDSLGLFQMRPSAGWGTVPHLTDPAWSTRAFYGGPSGPNHGSPRGLLDIPHWSTLSPGVAAQSVEESAYPSRYAVNVPVAEAILAAVTGSSTSALTCGPKGTAAGLPVPLPAGFAGAFISAAAKEIGVPYVWGGGDFLGPTDGGFDCSGLVLYAAYQASEGRIRLAHYTGTQMAETTPVAWANKQPGDIIFYTYPGGSEPHHVVIYLGGDRILQAPETGQNVGYGTLSEFPAQTATVRRITEP